MARLLKPDSSGTCETITKLRAWAQAAARAVGERSGNTSVLEHVEWPFAVTLNEKCWPSWRKTAVGRACTSSRRYHWLPAACECCWAVRNWKRAVGDCVERRAAWLVAGIAKRLAHATFRTTGSFWPTPWSLYKLAGRPDPPADRALLPLLAVSTRSPNGAWCFRLTQLARSRSPMIWRKGDASSCFGSESSCPAPALIRSDLVFRPIIAWQAWVAAWEAVCDGDSDPKPPIQCDFCPLPPPPALTAIKGNCPSDHSASRRPVRICQAESGRVPFALPVNQLASW